MTIDQNQTLKGEEQAQIAVDTAVASDQPAVTSDVTDMTPSEAPTDGESVTANAVATPEAETAPAVVTEEVTQAVVAETPAPAELESEHTAEPVATVESTVEAEPAAVEPEAAAVPEVIATPEPVAAPEPAPVAQTSAQDDAALFDSYMSGELQIDADGGESGFKRLSKGDRIEATVIHVEKDKVFVDLGTKAEGIIPLGELSEHNLETAKGLFNVGDKIHVIVLRPEGAEGNPIVSKRKADFESTWDTIEEAFRTETMITANVVDRVKGGLVVDVGVRGFVPATHVGSGKLRNIEKFVGQPMQLKVIEIDRERKKVVLSNRQAEEERRAAAKDSIFKQVKAGDIIEGAVRRLTDYGAFVDLGGVDGLLHISEMSWARINHPKEIFKEGQKIKVMVLRLDAEVGKISLGHRQVLPDPWNLIKENYRNQQTLKVTISRIVQSGAFIKLPEGAEAFMPISEMSYRKIKRPQDVIEEGQEVDCQIIDLRPDERRMVLSMRAIGGGGGGGDSRSSVSVPPTSGYEEDMRRADRSKSAKKGKKGAGRGRDDFEEFEDLGGRRGFATSGATIGERLGMLKGFLGREEDEEEAEKVEGEATDAEHTEAPAAVTPVVEAAAPKAAAPEAVAAETAVPEAAAPETDAPETAAHETAAHEATKE